MKESTTTTTMKERKVKINNIMYMFLSNFTFFYKARIL